MVLKDSSAFSPQAKSSGLGVGFWIVAVVTTLLSLLLGLAGSFIVPLFDPVFAACACPLPAATVLVRWGHHGFWAAFALALLLWLLLAVLPERARYRGLWRLAFIALALLCAAGVLLLVLGLYGPLWSMGTPVAA